MKKFNLKSGAKVLIVIIIAFLIMYGMKESSAEISDNAVNIKGMYGFSITRESIKDVRLLDELPKINLKKNGISIFGIHKGVYKVEGYDRIKLFVHGEVSYILIESNETLATVSFKNKQKQKYYTETYWISWEITDSGKLL